MHIPQSFLPIQDRTNSDQHTEQFRSLHTEVERIIGTGNWRRPPSLRFGSAALLVSTMNSLLNKKERELLLNFEKLDIVRKHHRMLSTVAKKIPETAKI